MDSILSRPVAVHPNDLLQPKARTFPHFKDLPLELRFKIYKLAIRPRLVPIFAYSVPFRIDPHEARRLSEYESDLFNGGGMISLTIERFFTSPRLITPLLHVDSESRSFSLSQKFKSIECVKSYEDYDSKRMFLHRHGRDGDHRGNRRPQFRTFLRAIPVENRQYSFVDPVADIFFLEDPRLDQEPEFVVSSIDAAVRWIGSYFLENLRSLAMPYNTWRKASLYSQLCTLTEFKALEQLYISLLGSEEQLPSRDWLSSVNGSNPYFEGMEKQVLDDFEELVKTFPDWKRPVIRFVKDKSVLLQQLGL